ncbi:hypothetical protein THAOC_26304, partial [Thalassiosira oceanica]
STDGTRGPLRDGQGRVVRATDSTGGSSRWPPQRLDRRAVRPTDRPSFFPDEALEDPTEGGDGGAGLPHLSDYYLGLGRLVRPELAAVGGPHPTLGAMDGGEGGTVSSRGTDAGDFGLVGRLPRGADIPPWTERSRTVRPHPPAGDQRASSAGVSIDANGQADGRRNEL